MPTLSLRPLLLALSLVTGCAQHRGAAASLASAPTPLAAPPRPTPAPAAAPTPAPVVLASPAAAIASPPRRHEPTDDVQTVRLGVSFHNLGDLARTLRQILDVEPERGPVRAILVDERSTSLYVIGTPAGVESVRRLLGPGLLVAPASM